MKYFFISAAVVILLFFSFKFLSGTKFKKNNVLRQKIETPSSLDKNSSDAGSLNENKIKEITVSGTEFSYSPSDLTLQKDEKVKIIFKNEGRIKHNLVIANSNSATKIIDPGQSDSLEFIAPSSGVYNFYCSVPGHKEQGMEGKIVVE